MTISIDLGSSAHPRNMFNADEVIGIDTFDQEEPKVIKHDLATGTLPFEDNSVDYVLAFDLLEHISRDGYRIKGTTFKTLELEKYNPFLDIMSSIWRILKPGGQFYAMTPVYPNKEAFRDPDHTNIISEDTVNYFVSNVGEHSMLKLTQHYGFKGDFELIEQRLEGAHVHWHLGAKKLK